MGGFAEQLEPVQQKRIGSGSVALDPPAIKVLQRAMAARGWDRSEMARVAGISRPSVTNVLHGRPVSAELLAKIAHALQRTPPDESVLALLEGELS